MQMAECRHLPCKLTLWCELVLSCIMMWDSFFFSQSLSLMLKLIFFSLIDCLLLFSVSIAYSPIQLAWNEAFFIICLLYTVLFVRVTFAHKDTLVCNCISFVCFFYYFLWTVKYLYLSTLQYMYVSLLTVGQKMVHTCHSVLWRLMNKFHRRYFYLQVYSLFRTI